MRLRRFARTAAALVPLIVGAASPAYGCLVLPESKGTAKASTTSDQIECGPVGCGPNAPFEELQEADAMNQGEGFSCDPMCVAGNPDHPGGATP